MSESTDPKTQAPALRGEAAWKAARDGVDARNAAAQKAGREARAASERERETERRRQEASEMKKFLDSRKD